MEFDKKTEDLADNWNIVSGKKPGCGKKASGKNPSSGKRSIFKPMIPIVSSKTEAVIDHQHDKAVDDISTQTTGLSIQEEPAILLSSQTSVKASSSDLSLGIRVVLNKENIKWREFVRKLIPNKFTEAAVNTTAKNSKPTTLSDDTIFKEILKIRNQVENYIFKMIVCMTFHQAIKTNRYTLISKIITFWKKSNYNIMELINSIYDECNPMTQACWCGSLECIKTIVAADPTNNILQTVHPIKGETLLQTLNSGKMFAVNKDRSYMIYITDRYNRCEVFITNSLARLKADQENVSESINIEPEIRSEIDEILLQSSPLSSLIDKIIGLYLSDIESAKNYFKAVQHLAPADLVLQITQQLADEDIELA